MLSRDYEEKRNFIRMAVECPVEITPEPAGEPFRAMARNLSGGGLLIECDRELNLGESLRVRLVPARSAAAPFEARVTVVRVERGNPAGCLIGVSIEELLR